MTSPTTGLAERDIVITGGTGALGAALVEAFLEVGAVCHVPFRGCQLPEGMPWAGHERARTYEAVDLLDEESVVRLYRAVPPPWASVHAAGGFAVTPIADATLETVKQQMELNFTTCFLCCREAVRAMRNAGGGGRIVNVASRPVLSPAAGLSAYAASKAAVASLTQTLGKELEQEGILVNAVLPSVIDTPANRRAMPDADFAQWPKPSEIARTVLFLASEANALTSGALVPVYGRS